MEDKNERMASYGTGSRSRSPSRSRDSSGQFKENTEGWSTSVPSDTYHPEGRHKDIRLLEANIGANIPVTPHQYPVKNSVGMYPPEKRISSIAPKYASRGTQTPQSIEDSLASLRTPPQSNTSFSYKAQMQLQMDAIRMIQKSNCLLSKLAFQKAPHTEKSADGTSTDFRGKDVEVDLRRPNGNMYQIVLELNVLLEELRALRQTIAGLTEEITKKVLPAFAALQVAFNSIKQATRDRLTSSPVPEVGDLIDISILEPLLSLTQQKTTAKSPNAIAQTTINTDGSDEPGSNMTLPSSSLTTADIDDLLRMYRPPMAIESLHSVIGNESPIENPVLERISKGIRTIQLVNCPSSPAPMESAGRDEPVPYVRHMIPADDVIKSMPISVHVSRPTAASYFPVRPKECVTRPSRSPPSPSKWASWTMDPKDRPPTVIPIYSNGQANAMQPGGDAKQRQWPKRRANRRSKKKKTSRCNPVDQLSQGSQSRRRGPPDEEDKAGRLFTRAVASGPPHEDQPQKA